MTLFYLDSGDTNLVRVGGQSFTWYEGRRGGAVRMDTDPNHLGPFIQTAAWYDGGSFGFGQQQQFHPSNYYGCGFWYTVGRNAIPDGRVIVEFGNVRQQSFLIFFDFYYRPQVYLMVRSNGSLQVWAKNDFGGSQAYLLGQSVSGVLVPGEPAFVEFKSLMASSGTYEARVNGIPVITGTGNTAPWGPGFYSGGYMADMLNVGCWGWTGASTSDLADNTCTYESIYCFDDGPGVNDLLGPCETFTRYPYGRGTTDGWVPVHEPTTYQALQHHWVQPPESFDGTFYAGNTRPYAECSVNSEAMMHLYNPVQLASGDIKGVSTMAAMRSQNTSAYVHAYGRGLGRAAMPNSRQIAFSSSAVVDHDHLGSPWTLASLGATEFGALCSSPFGATVQMWTMVQEVLVQNPVWRYTGVDSVSGHLLFKPGPKGRRPRARWLDAYAHS